jgi:threonine dehydratase
MELTTLDDVQQARERIRPTCLRTPILEVAHSESGDQTWIKAESLQRTGSFKLRGATNALATLSASEKARGVVTYSSGNHARALSYAASAVGVATAVVMPDSAPAAKIAAVRALGATVVLGPADQIVERARHLAETRDLTLVPPFDDGRVIAGQGTIALEIVDQVDRVEVVVAPVGGGGLVSGVAAAVRRLRPGARVIGAEPELAADLAEGYRKGERTAWSRERTGRTVADGLRSPVVGELPWAHISTYVDDVVTVSERSILTAMRWLAGSARLVVEPSGAVAAAAVLEHGDRLGGGITVAIATGGNVDPDTFAGLLLGGHRAATDP